MRRLSFLSLLLLFTTMSYAAAATPPPLRDFLLPPAYQFVRLSPNGTHLAIVIPQKNRSNRFMVAIVNSHSVVSGHPKVEATLGLRPRTLATGLWWANDNRLLVATGTRYGGFDQPVSTGRLWGVNANGGRNVLLLGPHGNSFQPRYFAGMLSRLPQEKYYVLVQTRTTTSASPWAYKLDIRNGKTYKVAQSPLTNGRLMADHAGNVRLAFGANTLTGSEKLYAAAPGSLNWKPVPGAFAIPGYRIAINNPTAPVMFTDHGKSYYWIGPADNPALTFGLYLVNARTGKRKLLYANPRFSLFAGSDNFFAAAGLISSFDRQRIVGVRIMPGKLKTVALDPGSAHMRLLAALERLFPGKVVELTSWAKQGNEAVVRVWDSRNLGSYYLYQATPKPTLAFMFRAMPWLNPQAMAPMEPITIHTGDGETLHGYLTLPPNVKPKNLPLIVIVHGGPFGIRITWGFDPETQLFASRGYAVLQVNFRGSGGYGYRFEALGIRHWGDTMQQDVAEATKWAIGQGIANPRRICIYGGSYGGYAALMSAELYPTLYHCAIGYSGVYSLPMLLTRKTVFNRSASGRIWTHEVLGTDTQQLREFSPLFNVAKLRMPVFLLHGGRDPRAPPAGFWDLAKAIKQHGTPLEKLFYPNEGHGFYKLAHREKAYSMMLAFLRKYIGPGGR